MSGYHSTRATAHGLEPTIDWGALFVLSGALSVAICGALVALL